MKVYIEQEELWPHLRITIEEPGGFIGETGDLPEDVLLAYFKASEAFFEARDAVAEAWESTYGTRIDG